jgi:lytic murein transglycosylase
MMPINCCRAGRVLTAAVLLAAGTMSLVALPTLAAPDAAFSKWLESLWPQAQSMGVSRKTFSAATHGLEPDLSLPDLDLPNRKTEPQRGQAEFVQTPGDYLRESSMARMAERGKTLAAEHRATLAAIEQKYGVPPSIILAIWGRETDFGSYKLPHNAIRVLATQGFYGRHKERFRDELLHALKILDEGHVTLANMRSSWAGAMGLTQFMPSDFFKYSVDFNGDGRRDIWGTVPDALASAGKQLADKGWKRGVRWAYEVRAPAGVDCTTGTPEFKQTVAQWLERGFTPTHGRRPSQAELSEPASLLQPEGTYGPSFLTLDNYFVIKEYNFSDLYVLFVGHVSDRMSDPRPFETPWSKNTQLKSTQVEAMQRTLTKLGLYKDKLDGKAGMLTRSALGQYQKVNRLRVDCWPTPAVLEHMQARNARN